ncbi:glycosyltransferase family 39 protein [Martelella mediterranea]|uniref:ArnT family glycosyltransferase n=1 Tax=Martelella mediterranea TaxID=293089 RepID=UPI001E30F6FD|nr:glycosyltransferase family 39 protein [Martelella mediterranea]MCD1634964.1 glycosyltransferase family 39 protein [Martelella mediterranea]
MVTPARPGNGKAGGSAVQRQQSAHPFSVETLSEKLTASPRQIAVAIVLAFTLVRLVWAYVVGFGIDESYTIGQSRFLALSYFDHPPLHYWIAHAAGVFFGTSWAVRIPTVLLFAATSWSIFCLTERLFGGVAAVFSVLFLNLSLFFLVSAGAWIVPDGPLMLFLACGAQVMARILFPSPEEKAPAIIWWILAGGLFGLAGLAKYSALFTLAGLVFFVIATRHRRQLSTAGPYVACFVGLIVILPVLVWNIQHDWASLRFQTGRGSPQFAPWAFARMVLGQIVWLGPWIAIPLMQSAVHAFRKGRMERELFCLALGVPAIGYTTLQALWSGAGFPHWPMPGWLFVFPLLGARLSGRIRPAIRYAIATSLVTLVLLTVAAALGASGALHRLAPSLHGPTADLIDWSPVAEVITPLKIGMLDGPAVAGLGWAEAGKLDLAVGDIAPVIALGRDKRGFGTRSDPRLAGRQGLVIVASEKAWAKKGKGLSCLPEDPRPAARLPVGRAGQAELTLLVIPVERCKGTTQ